MERPEAFTTDATKNNDPLLNQTHNAMPMSARVKRHLLQPRSGKVSIPTSRLSPPEQTPRLNSTRLESTAKLYSLHRAKEEATHIKTQTDAETTPYNTKSVNPNKR